MSEDLNKQNDVSPGENIDTTTPSDKVSYESHRKLLNEYKQSKTRLSEIETKYQELNKRLELEEENKMKEQQKWREIAEKKEKELKNAVDQIQFLNKKHQNKIKEDYFKKALGADLKKAFMMHVDLDSISIDEKGEVDEMTLQNAVEKFKDDFPELVPTDREEIKLDKKSYTLPQKNAKGKTNNISIQDLKGLSVRELKELYAEQLHNK
jgi:hypothetical protein